MEAVCWEIWRLEKTWAFLGAFPKERPFLISEEFFRCSAGPLSMTEGTGVGGELKSRADTPTPRSAKLCAEAMTASVPGKDTVLSFIQH